jgi:hypothetical protein
MPGRARQGSSRRGVHRTRAGDDAAWREAGAARTYLDSMTLTPNAIAAKQKSSASVASSV